MLCVVATPIGNLADVSPRAADALRRADVIACEDTRRTRILLDHLGVPAGTRMVSYREQTEQRLAAGLADEAAGGARVALCTDGGYPGVSDPGYRLIAAAAELGVAIEVIPGGGAVETALLCSGLPTSSFLFKGFPPRKAGALRRFFAEEAAGTHTLVVFESPFRVAQTLAAALDALGDRRAAVCVELTKKFERVRRGFLSDLAREFADAAVRGEVTVVIAGSHPKFRRPDAEGMAEPANDG